ncbi:hypothetical protein IG631_19601 [Alternaria alternata]|nr:hypothetical protein IG631_19601 [Alternaria alternata]
MTEESEIATIDPNGDMLIILKDPNTALLEWKEDKDLLEKTIAQAAAEATEAANSSEAAPLERELPQTRCLVSPRQMRIVSPYFENMFKFNYGETVSVFEDDLYHVQAQGWNPEAFAVVLNVAHVQLQAIPRKVSLASFAWFYVIADYYQMEGVLGLFTTEWFDQLKQQPMPITYSKELVLWMFLSVKLQDMETFNHMALIATRKACYPIQFLDLPFPPGAQGVSYTSMLDGLANIVAAARAAEDLESYNVCMISKSQLSSAFDGARVKFGIHTKGDEKDATARGEMTSANDVFLVPSNASRQHRIPSHAILEPRTAI